ncbi:hypothetical protein N0V93_005308 [Gnomoniopsis smithogilvyi]|uniref:N-acetyltransferase domain-containing protein n=1 Tax=Gnomoniopsis smithogilvyi TaxID=1191159 RepID=A0A9W8YUH7_9PEZI|nr:hypothetical protein N0V93_005308 [Gnomoniopsis smithogilvyi]
MSTSPVFCLPIQTPIFNDKVKLVPFEADIHSYSFVSQTQSCPELFAYMPSGYFDSVDEFNALITQPGNTLSYTNPGTFLFAIIDLTREHSAEDEEGELAGIVGYLNTSKRNQFAEIGPVIVLPKYQQTHVASNAVGLLMRTAYAPPEEGGLGLVRTEWMCNAANVPSMKVAERMGYQKVGVIPYHMKFPLGRTKGKVGNAKALPPGSDPDDVWRDTVIYSLSWDVWKAEARSKVEKAMARGNQSATFSPSISTKG